VDYAAITSTGALAAPGSCAGTITGYWCASTSTANGSLPAATYYATAVAYNGYVYQIGGNTGIITAVVDYAAITSTGALAAPGTCAGTITGDWCASTFTTNGSLPAATYAAAAVAYNGYVYQIGGCSTACPTAVVDYAAITSSGALAAPASAACTAGGGSIAGDWCASNGTAGTGANLPAATYYATAVAYNGYVYQIGGNTGAVVDYAAITSSGALAAPGTCAGTITGDWCASTSTSNGSLPVATAYATAVAYNGYVYQIGGYAGGATAVVDYAAINNGGPATLSAWAATGSLPAATYYAAAVAYNGYVYQIGGYAGSPTAVVDYAAITSSGALASPGTCAGTLTAPWCASTSTANGSLPAATYTATSVAYNGYIYEIGGWTGAATNAVYYAAINSSTGAVGTWTATGSLPAATYHATAVAYNGYVYQIGGYTTAATAVVDYAALTSSGALAAPGTCAGTITGDWCASTSTSNGSLPAATYEATAVAYNGYVYQIGGYTGSATAVVDYAAITSSGALAAPGTCAGTITGYWCASTSTSNGSLPVATGLATAVAYNGYVYQIGGYTTAATAVVDYAPIYNGGNIGPWSSTTSLPAATYYAAAVAYNGYVYQIGGMAGAVVDYAGLQSMPRIGFYSQLIDMSGSSTEDPAADYILANGSQTGDPGIGGLSGPGTGGISINYQFASNACPTFNSSTALTTSALVLGTPYPMTSSSNGCSSSSDTNFGRWVWVTVKLDDSQTATFPDSSGNHATLTGFTLYYHPATNGRLRGGATFSNGSLQTLDAVP
jgi:N-acetylneuraminic acid mutarotase